MGHGKEGEKVKILQINAVYGFGSTGRNVQELHEYYLSHGINSYVACAMYSGEKPTNAYVIGNKLDRKIHAFLSRVTDRQGRFSTVATKQLIRYIKNLNPDVVHIHNYHSNYVHYGKLLAFLAEMKVAVVLTLHDCFPFTGKCFHFVNCRQWETGCINCQARELIPPTFHCCNAAKENFRLNKELWQGLPRLGVVGVSDWITNEARKSILANAQIIRRIYNWIDPKMFCPHNDKSFLREYNCENKKILLAVAMSWTKSKGIAEIVSLAEKLGENYRIILVGKYEEKINTPDNIILWGRTQSVLELVKLYSNADVFINLSTLETFGKVTVEAMACGTPAIVYDATASPELIGDGCGKIVQAGDLDGMKRAVEEILSEEKTVYRERCISWVNQQFTLGKIAEQHINLYTELLYEKSGKQ